MNNVCSLNVLKCLNVQLSYIKVASDDFEVKDLEIEWLQWITKNGKTVKIVKHGIVNECFVELEDPTGFLLS